MEPETVERASAAADTAASQARVTARDAASLLARTAEVLERSAALAQEHAERRERAGRPESAAEERRVAKRAYAAAARARARAEQWLETIEAPATEGELGSSPSIDRAP